MKTRVLLADDHKMFREALRDMLGRDPDIEVVGEAGDGLAVFDLARLSAPDVVVMDIGMPGLNGIEATRRIVDAQPGVKVIALSAHCDRGFVAEMLGAGAAGYVVKAAASEELLKAIRAVTADKTYVCSELAIDGIDTLRQGRRSSGRSYGGLGRREIEILKLLGEGRSSPQIATQLHIASSTVDVHRRNIMRKLNLHSVAELTKWAVRHGLISA